MDFTNLKQFMEHMASERTPGNAVCAYLKGEKVFEYTCGFSDLEQEVPMTGEELFNIYSCSKITTVTAGVQLLEQGRFLLSDPLYEYIPEFRRMYIKEADGEIREAKNPITLGNLFTMTAGFSYDLTAPGFQKAKELTRGRMDTVETIRCVASDPLHYEPGTRWQYSLGHDVLAAVISVISGQKFRDYVKDNIFEPLNMEESFYHHTDDTLKRTAQQYALIAGDETDFDIVEAQRTGQAKLGSFKKIGKNVRHILGEEYDSGGAGITTTIQDYSKLLTALANYGTGLNGERILSPYSVNLMRTNCLDEKLMPYYDWKQVVGCGYGLGVRTHMNPAKSGVIANIGEFGWGGAAGATALIDPEINLAVFYTQHLLTPREPYYQPRLRNVVYSCL